MAGRAALGSQSPQGSRQCGLWLLAQLVNLSSLLLSQDVWGQCWRCLVAQSKFSVNLIFSTLPYLPWRKWKQNRSLKQCKPSLAILLCIGSLSVHCPALSSASKVTAFPNFHALLPCRRLWCICPHEFTVSIDIIFRSLSCPVFLGISCI